MFVLGSFVALVPATPVPNKDQFTKPLRPQPSEATLSAS
jgi:hypothetical protein